MRRHGLDIRRRAGEVLDRVGLIRAVLEARAHVWSPWLTILTYHSVASDTRHGFDPDVVDATPEQFDEQLSLFGRFFRFVSLDDVLAARRGKSLPPNPLLLTFDDGYRNNHDVVAPLLERHGAQGTFFVTTSYLNARRIFWWDRIHRLMSESRREIVELDYPERRSLPLGNGARGDSIEAVLKIVKNTYGLDLDRFLDHLADATGAGWSSETERQLADDVLMTWDQVRALARAGHAVQSHTRHHRVLQTLAPRQLPDELRGAREDLEEQLGVEVRTLAYPIGEPISRLADLRRAVQDAGYEVGFSNASGVNMFGSRWDPFDVKRIAVSRETSTKRIREMVALPWLISRGQLVHVDRPAPD